MSRWTSRALYLRATRAAGDPKRAEALYLQWLRDAAAARRPALPPVPGRQTRVELEARARCPRSQDVAAGSLGKWTRTLLEIEVDDAVAGPGEVHRAISAPSADAVRPRSAGEPSGGLREGDVAASAGADAASPSFALQDRLVALAGSGRGVTEALTAADPEAAAAALRGLRAHGAPVLRRVTQATGDEIARLFGRGSPGAAVPVELATRLAPHVGARAAGAARLHTDDAAALVAEAHDARALTIGADIFFGRGEYRPGTERGDELLAHELTHVAQGQRGELHRAAAKGVTGGTQLDPSEAEADLRAKLAVIDLHAPAGAAPPLAAPTGQPTSDGDRQARLAAQQQRLGVASQPDAPVADAQPPPASAAQAPVPHPPPAMKPAPQPAPTGNAYVNTFNAPPSKQAMELWGKAGTQATTQTAADQVRFDAALPPMPVNLDGGEPKGGKGAGPAGKAAAKPPPAGAPPPAAQPTPTPAVPPVTAGAAAAQSFQPSADKAQMKADGQQVLDDLPTTAPDVKTDPGPAPVTDLAGQADPVRTVGDHQHAITESAKALDTAKQKVISGPGAAAVQPVKLDEKLTVPSPQAAGAMPQLPPVDGMAKFKKWNLPSSVQGSFDQLARPQMDQSLAQGKARMTEAEHKRDADRTRAVSDAQDKVKAAHADADKQQQSKVADARTQISNHQADTLVKHEAEIKKLDQQSGTRKSAAIGKINDRISADQAKVASDYQDAQKKAEDQKKQGEEDAKKKKEEAEKKKKDESFWDQVGDAISDGIKAIADEIGEAIGKILDAVKDAACKVIDAARDFVCQALTEFGDWLKSAVDALIDLIGLGGIADKIRGIIEKVQTKVDQAIDKLIDRVMKLFKGKGDKKDDKPDDKDTGDVAVPKSLAEPERAVLDKPSEAVEKQAAETQTGAVLYQKPESDPKQVTRELLAKHSDALFDKSSGVLTLPPVRAAALASSGSLNELAGALAEMTGVSKVTFVRDETGWYLDGAINPKIERLASYKTKGDALDDLRKSLGQQIGKKATTREVLLGICRERAAHFGATVEFIDSHKPAAGGGPHQLTTTAHFAKGGVVWDVDIVEVSDDNKCPCCGREITHSTNTPAPAVPAPLAGLGPHSVIPNSVWQEVLNDVISGAPAAGKSYAGLATLPGTDPALGVISGAISSTTLSRGLDVKGRTRHNLGAVSADRQCEQCDQYQDRTLVSGRFRGKPATMVQRGQAVGAGVTMTGGPTGGGVSEYHGRQFEKLTPRSRKL